MLNALPALIGAASSFAGGLLNQRAVDKQNKQARADAVAVRNEDIALQKEFAQNSVKWRVEDAERSGIHPLYALGAPSLNYGPVGVNLPQMSGSPMGDALSSMGQDVGRAVEATMSRKSKGLTYMEVLATQRAELENMLLASQIAKNNQGGSMPGLPTGGKDPYLLDGQGDSGTSVENYPLQRVVPGGQPNQEPGAITDVGYARTKTGWAPVPSQDAKQRIEDSLPLELLHFFRNNIMPTFGHRWRSPPFPAPPGRYWQWTMGEYRLRDARVGVSDHY